MAKPVCGRVALTGVMWTSTWMLGTSEGTQHWKVAEGGFHKSKEGSHLRGEIEA